MEKETEMEKFDAADFGKSLDLEELGDEVADLIWRTSGGTILVRMVSTCGIGVDILDNARSFFRLPQNASWEQVKKRATEVEYYLNYKLRRLLGKRAVLEFSSGDDCCHGCYGLYLTVY